LEVGDGAKELTPEKFTVTKPPEKHGGGQDPQRVVATVKKNAY
jgi:hypothetical protein